MTFHGGRARRGSRSEGSRRHEAGTVVMSTRPRALPVPGTILPRRGSSGVLILFDVVDVTSSSIMPLLRTGCVLASRTRQPVEGPSSLFVKLAPLDPTHREMIGASGMGEREASFYADVARSLDLRVPHAYFAASSDDGNFAILLEDLAAGGCTFSDGESSVTADAAAVALEELAGFHARFEDPAARTAAAPWMAVARPQPTDVAAQLMRMVLDHNADALSPSYVAVGELFVDHHARLEELWNAGPQTYIHGDAHIGNVFLDRGRVGFVDWGLSRVSTHLRDISYFLTMTVDPMERRRSERDLLRLYLDAVRAAGGTHRLRRGLVRPSRPSRLHRRRHVPRLHALIRRPRRASSRGRTANTLRTGPRRTRGRRGLTDGRSLPEH